MRRIVRRSTLRYGWGLVCTLSVLCAAALSFNAAEPIPPQISDEVFWRMVTDMSEPDGFFRFENFLSNELGYQYVIPQLQQSTRPGGIYMGVGPEQNFTYIVALQPKMAFVIDIRRQNMLEHLMYKALFELSADRAEFLSKLFARKRPAGLNEKSTPEALFRALAPVPYDEGLYKQTLQAMKKLLVETHQFGLRPDDLDGYQSIDYVYSTFVESGPTLDYSVGANGAGQGNPTYEDLMVVDDGRGVQQSFLATEANYRFVRELERKNLIIPLVGDFGGSKTIRAVGQFLKDHEATVTAFYLSNVEQYLFQDFKDRKFYENVSALPVDSASTFIRTFSGGGFGGPYRFQSTLSSMTRILSEFKAGRLRSIQDVRVLSN